MAKFAKPKKDLNLIITIEGEILDEVVGPEEYFELPRGSESIPVIRHDTLVRIAEKHEIKIEKTILEFGVFHGPKNFCFIHRATGKLSDGTMIDEVGEANPRNLDPGIGEAYPAIMSNKRAQDRLLIRMLGLQGQAYSDVEFGGTGEPEVEEEPLKLTRKEAAKVMADWGSYKSKPIPLGELQEKHPEDFDWLLNKYKVGPRSSPKMKRLHYAARALVERD